MPVIQHLTLVNLRKWFLQGFIIVAPTLLTFAVVLWIAGLFEAFLGGLLRIVLSPAYYVPGMGLLLGLLLILGAGMFANYFLVQRLVAFAEHQLDRIPVVKSLFKGIKEVSEMLATRRPGRDGRVVTVDLGGIRLIGFVTQPRATLPDEAPADESLMAVYLPMSYQIGGYTLYLSRDRVTPLNVSAEDAMRAVLTGGQLSSPVGRNGAGDAEPNPPDRGPSS